MCAHAQTRTTPESADLRRANGEGHQGQTKHPKPTRKPRRVGESEKARQFQQPGNGQPDKADRDETRTYQYVSRNTAQERQPRHDKAVHGWTMPRRSTGRAESRGTGPKRSGPRQHSSEVWATTTTTQRPSHPRRGARANSQRKQETAQLCILAQTRTTPESADSRRANGEGHQGQT